MKIKQAAAYIRSSIDKQWDESIDDQVQAIEDYCKQNNYKLVKIYFDRAKTATSDKRPEFQKMIEDSGKGLFDTVIVHKVNRFSRNMNDSIKYNRKLKANGVSLLSVTEKIDGSVESAILESLLEGMAEHYRKWHSARR